MYASVLCIENYPSHNPANYHISCDEVTDLIIAMIGKITKIEQLDSNTWRAAHRNVQHTFYVARTETGELCIETLSEYREAS